ncbi:unnamed protein product [Porites evermanni]|uniref:Platelet-derived growth factor (PDGF) family profile domain-containing protein n=1 Tax=Porites evermanni TaxID=104178 RepID=A0ABN8LYV5_9CNID|nr:unnamed protein product [Porites evermanni]
MARIVIFIYLSMFIFLMSNLVSPSSSYSESKQKLERTLSNVDMATADLKSYIGKRVKHAKMMEMNKRFTDGDEPGEERKRAVKLPMQHCHQERLYWPSFVELHRCAGGCSSALQCTVKKQEEVTILVEDINNNLKKAEISLSNHTACNCSCKQECNRAKQRFRKDTCSCECIEDGSHCNENDNKKWNKRLCKCECLLRLNCCLSETWSESSCKCEEKDPSIPAF